MENKTIFGLISKNTFGQFNARDVQTNSSWAGNPYGEDYAIIPEELIEGIVETRGFCDIELNENGTEVVSFTPREIPEILAPQKQPTTEERLAALEMAMLEQIGVVTE